MPYIVPAPRSAPETGFGQFTNKLGENLELARDVLLKAMLSGQISKTPAAGQYTSPTGASTFISPAERVAANPNISAAQAIDASGAGTLTPTQYSGFQINPSLDRLVQQMQLRKAQYEMSPQNPANRLAASTANLYDQYAGTGTTTPTGATAAPSWQQPSTSQLSPDAMKKALAQMALQADATGDEATLQRVMNLINSGSF